jgi:hypothetical protein
VTKRKQTKRNRDLDWPEDQEGDEVLRRPDEPENSDYRNFQGRVSSEESVDAGEALTKWLEEKAKAMAEEMLTSGGWVRRSSTSTPNRIPETVSSNEVSPVASLAKPSPNRPNDALSDEINRLLSGAVKSEDTPKRKRKRGERDCPKCGEIIPTRARVCRYCQSSLVPPKSPPLKRGQKKCPSCGTVSPSARRKCPHCHWSFLEYGSGPDALGKFYEDRYWKKRVGQ